MWQAPLFLKANTLHHISRAEMCLAVFFVI